MTKIKKKRKYVRKINAVVKTTPVKTKKKRKYARRNKNLEKIAGTPTTFSRSVYADDAESVTGGWYKQIATPDDPVNHPSHYTSHKSGVECIQITRHMGYNVGSVMAYMWRAGIKDPETKKEDLQKAVFHLQDEINQL